MLKDLDLKKNSLSLYVVIAFALPIVTTIIVVLVAGAPSGLVVTEMSVAALVVVMGMVHAPTIAAIAVVFRSQRFTGGQLSFVSFALTSGETIVWNAAFSAAVIGIVAFLLARNKDLMGR